jgi:hypothetical protein
LRLKRRSLSKAIATATIPVLKVVGVHLHFEALIREYYRDCGQMDTETWTIIAVRQAESSDLRCRSIRPLHGLVEACKAIAFTARIVRI